MSSTTVKYLVTGATRGLGAAVLSTLYKTTDNPSEIVAASSRASSAAELQKAYPGTQFRVANYDDPQSLEEAFVGVERLFFVSSPLTDVGRRAIQHGNVIETAKKTGVRHVRIPRTAFVLMIYISIHKLKLKILI